MTKIIDGKILSAEILDELAEKAVKLKDEKHITPGLAVLLIGDNPASEMYVKSKIKSCSNLGYYSITERLPADTSEEKVLDFIHNWNNNHQIHGILVQLPLPEHINEDKVLYAINPAKDVDGFHPVNLGRLLIGMPSFAPCTPAGIVEMLKRSDIETSGKHTVVVGRSNIVGKPIANMMYQKKEHANSIVTICHSAAKDLKYYTKQADILIAAIGRAHLIGPDHVKEGAVIIDVGINRVEDKSLEKGYRVVGDVDYDAVFDKVSAITPVPGGVGRMTIAMLMYNTYVSASGEFKV
ncbi:MAG: bifunctional methylenetetrahydrofolate dehydrogenase/methenyltetrahydrofolate cyclohydrolase FolD [Candidatus Kapaibacterium sp.]